MFMAGICIVHSTLSFRLPQHTPLNTPSTKETKWKKDDWGKTRKVVFFIFPVSIINMHEFYGRLRCDQLFINSMLIASTFVNI